MALARSLRIERSWTFGDPYYFSVYGSFSLPIFHFLRKNDKNLSSISLNILQNALSNSIHLAPSFSCAAVSNASLRVRACEMMATFEITNASFTYTKYYYDCLPLLTCL